MPKSIRIRTQPGLDQNIKVNLNQDFDFLEILSLKITQSEIYTRMCSDYGVVVGRVIANNGYGVPNAHISVFIPLSDEDSDDPIISTLYPYKTLTDVNDDGYRYNLLPYIPSYTNHVPTGTFPDREDVLINRSIIEVYDKYYKFSVRTNESGDFMIFGVPVGSQTIVMDLDLSDIGEFSLTPQDLIRMGMATADQVSGVKFQSSTNLDSLPQIINLTKEIEVLPFWGQEEVCQFAITRTDFDLVKEANLDIQPTAVFMGSIVSTLDKHALKKNCKVKTKAGELCNLITGPGEILAIRQTVFLDSSGYPVLEQANLEQDGKVIDENGTWMIDLPMNLDYVYTNEFGQQVLSSDPKIGIPTKGKYRFKVKWDQPNTLDDPIRRAYFLVPNIREYGWNSSSNDPINANTPQLQKSYAFSLDWNDYVDPQAAVNCEDTFYEFAYNQVYTISQLIDQYRGGTAPRRVLSIKNILDDTCESRNNPFPSNDAQFRPDFIYLLFTIFLRILTPIFIAILAVIHVLGFLLQLLIPIIQLILFVIAPIVFFIQLLIWGVRKLLGGNVGKPPKIRDFIKKAEELGKLPNKLKTMNLPNLTYPECEMCNCTVTSPQVPASDIGDVADNVNSVNLSTLSDWNIPFFYDGIGDILDNISTQWIPDPDNPNPYPIDTGADTTDPTSLTTPIQSILAGKSINYSRINTSGATYDSFMPYYKAASKNVNLQGVIEVNPRVWFSTNLTISERLNLFNTKAKYFENLPGSGTQAPNQIEVQFNYPSNGNLTHFDNVMVLSCDAGSETTFEAGTIVYFQNPQKSGDVNAFSASSNNQFGIPCTTGSSVNTSSFSKQIFYADPNNPNNSLNQTYFLTANTAVTEYHTFPVDIEYFQVITAMTIGDFGTLQNPNAPINTLWNRFLNNTMRLRMQVRNQNIVRPYVFRDAYPEMPNYNYLIYPNYPLPTSTSFNSPLNTMNGTPWELVNPLTASTQGYDQVLVFLVRGVDPYSTRQKNRYHLGRLFGYTNHQQITIEGDYKLNIPIQTGLKNAKHDQITTNTGLSSYSNSGVFYENFNYQPGNDFSAFTTNLHTYYSALDSSLIGIYNVRNYSGIQPSSPTTLFDGNNVYPSPTYGDTRIQGPRSFQKHQSSTTLGGYWSSANWGGTDLNQTPCLVDEIVWPQSNIGSTTYLSTSTNIIFAGSISPLQNIYRPQEFNVFTCDYTAHKLLYGRRGWNSGASYYTTPLANTALSCLSIYKDPFDQLQFSSNSIDFFSDEPDGCWTPVNDQSAQNKGYYNDESIEGGSLFGGKWYWIPNSPRNTNTSLPNCYTGFMRANGWFASDWNYEYFAPTYSNTISLTITVNRYTVFRSDRLPTSTSVSRMQNNSFALHQNPLFLIATATDDGINVNSAQDSTGVNFSYETGSTPSFSTADVSDSLSDCGKMVPLDCYYTQNNNSIAVNVPPNSCFQHTTKGILGLGSGTYNIFNYGTGCYVLVQKFITGLPKDIQLLLEWKSRLDITFAACRNVFSHYFTNNWVNGTLFAYSIRNDKEFDANNQAVYKYCNDTIVFHTQTNNYYYRSSPFDGSNFIGKNSNSQWQTNNNNSANQKNLQNPTTILNLGPRNEFIQQIVTNNNYDGYIVDKLKDTTFNDPSDILNIFIISRLANSNFIQQLLGINSAGIFSYFTRETWNINTLQKQKQFIDSDYAQALSISSEFAVNPYDEDDNSPVFFYSLGNDSIVGFTFTSNNQFRDYISPRRTIYSEINGPSLPTDFEYIPVKTQEVPFYGWKLKTIDPSHRYIFGSQHNTWDTNQNTFAKYYYQNLDRLNLIQISDYMTPSNVTIPTSYLKGYIINYKYDPGTFSYILDTDLGNTNPFSQLGGSDVRINVGAPFHFYFGLIKGATAYNRFYKKWVAGEIIT